MRRQVTAHLELDVTEPALLALQIAVATPAADEKLIATLDGAPVEPREVAALHGGRMHVLDADRGRLVIDYSADVDGRLPTPETSEYDLLSYRRPSRYCRRTASWPPRRPSSARSRTAAELARSVTRWVNQRLLYLGGSSGPSDDAVDTLLLGEGVCRDYAHLVLALLRARDVPARLVAVYAPGSPRWTSTPWSRRGWMTVAAAGRDRAGAAVLAAAHRHRPGRRGHRFLSVHHGQADLLTMSVVAVVDALPTDDPDETVDLG